MPAWAAFAHGSATAASFIALEPLSATHVIFPADAAAVEVAEPAFQRQSWVSDSLQGSQVLSTGARDAPGWIWSTRLRVLFGGSLREVQEQEALQQLEDHIAEQERRHQEALLQRGFADRAAAARHTTEQECAVGGVSSGSAQQPQRADDKEKVEDGTLVQWAVDYKPRDPTMPYTRLDMDNLGRFAVCCHIVAQPGLIEFDGASCHTANCKCNLMMHDTVVVRHMIRHLMSGRVC
jgi:hypothetical protein